MLKNIDFGSGVASAEISLKHLDGSTTTYKCNVVGLALLQTEEHYRTTHYGHLNGEKPITTMTHMDVNVSFCAYPDVEGAPMLISKSEADGKHATP